jgi:hypothetical protein
MANSLSISDLQTIVYEITARAGLFTNSGPAQEAFNLQAIIDDYIYCMALTPPDVVRADQLLTFANQSY